ncbi:MAG: flagellin [Fimbriimonadaceae bacterium]
MSGFRINNNIQAMATFRNLNATNGNLSKSINRLSTGLRINSAADDPAGLIASESMRAQLSGMDAALRNNQDALNYAKTADSALDEVNALLKDARALAVANGSATLDAAQKQANQTQFENIMASIDRVAGTTQFGTRNILDGSAGATATVSNTDAISAISVGGQFGGNAITSDGTVAVEVTEAGVQTTAQGTVTFAGTQEMAADGTLTVNGKAIDYTTDDTMDDVIARVNSVTDETGVTAALNGTAFELTNVEFGSDTFSATDTGGIQAGSLAVTAGTNAEATVTYTPDGGSGVTAAFTANNEGNGLILEDADGNTIQLSAGGNTDTDHEESGRVFAGDSMFQIGANAGQTAQLALGNFEANSLATNLKSLDLTVSDQTTNLTRIDEAISKVTGSRANIGSFMKDTLESNIRNLNVAKETLAATESAIRDVDFAAEMTSYTKSQILQQSGMSMLAQANSMGQSVLSLL